MRVLNGGASAALWSGTAELARPGLRLWLTQRLARGKERPGRLAERYGIDPTPRPAGRLVWLHAASVGETASIFPLLLALGKADRELHLLVTTASVTAADLLQDRLPRLGLARRAYHRFVPLDVPDWASRFLAHWRPDGAVFVESELWPNLIAAARAREIPLALVNARLSAKSYRHWRLAAGLARRMLTSFVLIAARSEGDARRLASLGARAVETLGDLKQASLPLEVDEEERRRLAQVLDGRPRWLAASTHPGEEEIVAKIHRTLAPLYPDLVTIIAPRHPEEGKKIAAKLGALTCRRRSLGQDPSPGGVWIADTLGELGLLYRLAPIVFVGKSLVGRGGQNPIEPARLGAAIAVGPYTENFADAVAQLAHARALVTVRDAEGLGRWVAAMLEEPMRARAMGEAALGAFASLADLPERLAARILALSVRGHA